MHSKKRALAPAIGIPVVAPEIGIFPDACLE